jgi:uncharacterized protein YbaR (Trm112 family)
MSIDQRLLDILCCPISKTPVVPLSKAQLEVLNSHIKAGHALNVEGQALSAPLQEGLITTDSKVIYPIDDGIPVMLPESGIGTTQFDNFPKA